MANRDIELSVIVPVFNRERTIAKNLKIIEGAIAEFEKNFEIITVNDGSTDNTLRELKKVQSTKIRVCGYSRNKGKGFALSYGFSKARGKLIAFLDCDLDLHPRQLKEFYNHIATHHIVIGSKRHPRSVVSYPLKRRILSALYQTLISLVFGLNVRDTQVGIKLAKRTLLEDVLSRLVVKRYAFDLELLVVAHKLGYKIKEAPIVLNYQFDGTGINIKAIWHILVDTLAIAYRLYWLRYYDKKHTCFGMAGYPQSLVWRGRKGYRPLS